MKLMELLFINSGGIFEASKYGPQCELSRHTIKEYFSLLAETSVISPVRPFSAGKARELTSAPKVYSFDTGFTAFSADGKSCAQRTGA
jgi:predicted AAA+ superfamily ATPase